jgi:N-acetylglucosamine malate deacetylase 1
LIRSSIGPIVASEETQIANSKHLDSVASDAQPRWISDLPRRVLVLAPHTDDAELGCGGTLNRFCEDGATPYIAAFSTAEESRLPGTEPGALRKECLASMTVLNISEDRRRIFDFPVRHFSDYRQDILERMIALRQEFDPEIVFIPTGSDLHQDHQIIHAEAVRAFKDRAVWGYELPWNQIDFKAQAFVMLKQRHLAAKWRALQSYQSQIKLGRPYFTREFIEGLARVRGVQVKVEFAEAFEVIRFKW